MDSQKATLHDRTNDVTSGILHLAGAGLAVAVMVVLVVSGVRYGSPWHVVGYSLYGAGLILLYVASATYHLVPHHFVRAKEVLQRLDHAMIFILIAATYTPITFIALSGAWRWSIFGIIWLLALIGALLKMFSVPIPRALSPVLYIAMGWFIFVAFAPLRETLTTATMWLLLAGGISYTLGVIFFALDKMLPRKPYFWMHEIFHVFVLGGSALHTIAMFLIL
ncbi:MAG: hemolysin III family protein [Minisyncoccia bacterium]